MTTITYKPPGSVQDYIQCEKFISLIWGPIGSGKTTASIFKMLYHAARMRPQADGIRRSRCVVIRNTRAQLTDTTIPSIQTWFPPDVAPYFKTENKMIIKLGDVELELLFRGLDDEQDVRKLLSLEVSFAFLDECREIRQSIFEAVQGRVGRYPSKAKGGCVSDDGKPNHHVFGSSNPADFDSFWQDFSDNPPATAEIFFQPSGLSPEADWIDNLIDGYYETIAEGKSEDWKDVYIHAKWGKSLSGQPVFRSFDRRIHVSSAPLNPIRMSTAPLLIGMDFGLSPACTISQVIPDGRLLTYAEATSEGMGTLRFIREKLRPILVSHRFAGMSVLVVGDPAGQQRAQTDERTCYDMLKAEGFRVVPAKTNAIGARINGVDSWLTRMIDGKPGHLIDPSCEMLIKGMAGGYRYKLTTKGELADTPEKNSYSHVADAHQYACGHAAGGIFGGPTRTVARPVEKVRYTWA